MTVTFGTQDVDLKTGEIRIRQQLQRIGKQLVAQELKTKKSRRTLIVPSVWLNAVRLHRKRQLRERLKAGANWIDSGLVFTTFRNHKGNKIRAGLHPRSVLRTLRRLVAAAAANLPCRRLLLTPTTTDCGKGGAEYGRVECSGVSSGVNG